MEKFIVVNANCFKLKLHVTEWLLFFFFQNIEAEKQVKFFQGCVAVAFAERDNSIMEVIIATTIKLEHDCTSFVFSYIEVF